MAKALKIAGVVTAIAGLAIVTGGAGAFAFAGIGSSVAGGVGAVGALVGVSAGTLFTVAAGLTLGASLLSPKPKPPNMSPTPAGSMVSHLP